jgi:predicted membrane channel-forming protein YqfA (hemolysin III family)
LSLRERFSLALLVCMGVWLVASPAQAQMRTGTYAVRVIPYSPIIALIAGILILIVPRLLNYIVAIYLIIIGLFGLFGRY